LSSVPELPTMHRKQMLCSWLQASLFAQKVLGNADPVGNVCSFALVVLFGSWHELLPTVAVSQR
jgi:hypothetical protein